VTCPDKKAAEKIADIILGKRQAACISIIPDIASRYWWKGKIEKSKEVLLIIKTRKNLVKRIEKTVKENHPYEVPEVIAIPVVSGSVDYLDWLEKETR
jgi:periplasmic divalent cation tolerance protein